MKIKKLEAWAKKNGLECAPIYTDGAAVGILIYTDYSGPYPPESVYAIHDRIRAYCRRTGRRCESGSMHTGIRIWS